MANSTEHRDEKADASRFDDRQQQPKGDGDFRGPYGYGRPAHKSDPDARYGFDTPLHPDKH